MPVATPARVLQIALPPLHPGQQLIENSSARFKVVVCGRRWGKTTYGVSKCVAGVLTAGGNYWWIGPTYKVATIGWDMLLKLVRQLQDAGVEITTNKDELTAYFPKGRIVMKSSDNPELLRGEKLAGCVFDEAAQHKQIVWTEVIRPSLADLKGWALFIGTPKGKNWLFELHQQAKHRNDWAAFKMLTTDNPYIDSNEIAAAKLEMSEESFKQEFEADFGASQYLVYPEFSRDKHQWKGLVPPFTRFIGALDFGGTSISSHMSTGLVAGITDKDEIICVSEFEQAGPNIAERQMNWMFEQERRMIELSKKVRDNFRIDWTADKTQMVGIQLMRGYGFSVFPTKGGPDSVEEGIELVHRRLKIRTDGKPRWYYTDNLHFIPEALERYRYPQPEEGKVQARKPLKIDDDMADTIRYGIERVDRSIIGDPAILYRNALPQVVN